MNESLIEMPSSMTEHDIARENTGHLLPHSEGDDDTIFFSGVGHVLRTYRIRAGFSLESLSQRLHMHASLLSAFEEDRKSLSDVWLERFAATLDVPANEVFQACLEHARPSWSKSPLGRLLTSAA